MRIGLAGWSLNRRFKSGQMDLMRFPKIAVEEFELKVLELNSPFFASTEKSYLKDLGAKIKLAGCEVANIAVDSKGDLASTSETERREAVRRHAEWFTVADLVGSRCIRGNAGGARDQDPTEEQIQACIRSFTALASIAMEHGKKILIENHSSRLGMNPDVLARIMQADTTGCLGMVPDFGNWAPERRYEGLEKVMPYAAVLHAKMYEFAADGTDTKIDVARCMEIAKKAKFNGDVMIEFEGQENDHDAVLKAKTLLERCM